MQTAAGGPHALGPSDADVMFGRACLAFGLVTREHLVACVADQRRLTAEGRPFTLAQVMIGRKLITADVYQQVVARIRAHLATQQGAAPVMPPDITASGRYHNVNQALGIPAARPQQHGASPQPQAQPQGVTGTWGSNPTKREMVEAARSWDDASSIADAPDYEVLKDPLAISVEPAHVVVNPIAVKKERRDTGIRRILGVSEDAEQFDFGPYRILNEVAAGGMGVIYRAQAAETGTIYALKALINVENANEKQLRRFIQEAQSAMRLDHPGIVRIHDIGIFENIPYFTMDLVAGNDLQHHLRAKTFPLDPLLEILVGICSAVDFAHENQVIHRDLKPANIIIREGDRAPILTDFGLAKNLDSTFKLTAEGAMVGTPLFLSPEQVSGKGAEVDRRCDVYGLGVMMYQMLTDRLPFVGRNPYEVYRKVLEEDPTPPTQVNPAISPELEKICLMALAKDKNERFDTAALMGTDIGRYLAGQSVDAQLPTPVAVAKARKKGGGSSRKKGKKKKGGTSAPAGAGGQASPAMLAGIVGLLVLIVVGVIAIVMLLSE